MKIVTWNICHGGGRRIDSISSSIKRFSPDVIVITEYRKNKNGEKIKKCLYEIGFRHFIAGDVSLKKNTVLLASRKYIHQNSDISFEHNVICGKINGLNILAVYFPQRTDKIPVFKHLLQVIKSKNLENAIIVGDLNTGKHEIDEKGRSFVASEYLDFIEAESFCDVWRLINGDKREYSWFSNKGNGFRIDHCFVSGSLSGRVVAAKYDHLVRVNRISDHAALIVELNEDYTPTNDCECCNDKQITISDVDNLLSFYPKLYSLDGRYVVNNYDDPYPKYHPVMREFFRYLGKSCWDDHHYDPSEQSVHIRDLDFVRNANLQEIRSMLTWSQRGEKFGEGHWEAVLCDGKIYALLNRLKEIRHTIEGAG